MKSALDVRPGVVYFMERVDLAQRVFKIGWTDRSVDTRRAEIQAQYGARLEIVHTVETPAATFLERHLHRRNARTRIDQEWFRFSGAALSEAIDDAEDLNGRLDPNVVRRAQHSALTASDGHFLPVGPDHPEWAEVLLHFADVPALLRSQVELDAEQLDIAAELRIATGTSRGIDGVTKRAWASPTPVRSLDRLRRLDGAAATRYELPPDSPFFGFLVRSEAPRRNEDDKTIRDRLEDRTRPRDGAAEDAHRRHLVIDAKLAAVEAQLGMKELILRAALGANEGFEGVCAYSRRPAVDWDRLEREDADLFARCSRDRAGSVRFGVLPYREYL